MGCTFTEGEADDPDTVNAQTSFIKRKPSEGSFSIQPQLMKTKGENDQENMIEFLDQLEKSFV